MANNPQIKTTSKGTELPLISLKGKPYLQVAHRLVWFREEHPTGSIVTEFLQLADTYAVAKATISIDGKVVSTGTKKETEENFGDFVEKAETGAIGRALSAAGFGTQFDPELDEGSRIVDSPIAIPNKKGKNDKTQEYVEDAPNTPKVNESKASVSSVRSAANQESNKKTNEDYTKLREVIKSAARVLDSQKKLSIADFKTKYLTSNEKLDDLNEGAVRLLYSQIKKEYPELQLN